MRNWKAVVLGLCLGAPAWAEEGEAESPALGVGAQLYSAEELARLPGTFGDPLRGVMLLPGVSHVVSGVGLPVVRGLQPSSTGVYLDGVRLPFTGHFLLGPSVLNPALLSGLEVQRGSPGAQVGRELGGAISLAVARVPEREGRLVASLDLLNAGLLAQQRLDTTGTEVTLAGRFGYSPWLASQVLGGVVARMWDYQAHLVQRLGAGELRLLAVGAGDAGGLTRGVPAGVGGLSFHRVDLRGRLPVGRGVAEAALTYGWDALDAQAGGTMAQLSLGLAERTLGGRTSLSLPIGDVFVLRAGGDVELRQASLAQSTTVTPWVPEGETPPLLTSSVLQPLARVVLAGAWVEGRLALGDWQLVPGLRVDGWLPARAGAQVTVEPRLFLRRPLSESLALRVGGGLHHQAPAYLVDVPAAEMASLRDGLQRVARADVGVDWQQADWLLTADAFFHLQPRTVELSLLDADFLSVSPLAVAQARETRGHAYGVELGARRELADGWTALVGYTFQQAQRTGLIVRHGADGQALTREEATYASALEQAHVVNAALSVELPAGWRLGGGVHFNTGAPEAGGLASFTQQQGVEVRDATRSRWVPADRDAVARLPPYFRVDARVDKTWTWGPVQMLASLELLNAALARETFRYDYRRSADGTLERVASGLPPVTLPGLRVQATY